MSNKKSVSQTSQYTKFFDAESQGHNNVTDCKEIPRIEYNSDLIPPNWELADQHYLASQVGDIDMDKMDVNCTCCGKGIHRKELSIFCQLEDLQFMGSGYPLFFTFIKYCSFILVTMILASGIYSVYSNYYGADCHGIDYFQKQLCAGKTCSNSLILQMIKNKKLCLHSLYNDLSLANTKTVDQYLQNILNLITIILIIIILQVFRYQQRKIHQVVDDQETSPSDFTICIKHIPFGFDNYDYDDLIKKAIIEKALPGKKAQILKVVLAYDLTEFNNLTELKKQKIQIKKNALAYFHKNGKFQEGDDMNKIDNDIKEQETKLEALQKQYEKGQTNNFCGVAFAYCHTEDVKDELVKQNTLDMKTRISQGFFNANFTGSQQGLVIQLEKGDQKMVRKLLIEEATEPSDVLWNNLKYSTTRKFFVRLFTNFLNMFFLTVGATSILFLMKYQVDLLKDQSISGIDKKQYQRLIGTGIGILITVINIVLSIIAQKLAEFETHSTRTKLTTSIAYTSSIIQFANTALVSFLIQVFFFENYWGNAGLINTQSKIILMNAIVPAVKGLINPGYIIASLKRWYYRRAGDKSTLTQEEAQLLYQNPEFMISQAYADIQKTMFMTAMYAPLMPFASAFSLFGLFLIYWVHKYNLLKKSKVSFHLDKQLCLDMTEQLEYFIIIFAFSDFAWHYIIFKSIPIFSLISIFIGVTVALIPMQQVNEKLFKLPASQSATENFYQCFFKFEDTYEKINPVLSENALKDFNEIDRKYEDEQKVVLLQKLLPLPN